MKCYYDKTKDKKVSTPGVGSYNIRESSSFQSKIKKVPRCAFGREKRQGVQIKLGPAPNAYSPVRNEKYRAPRPFIPMSVRLGSAAPGSLKKGKSLTSIKVSSGQPGPGEYYLPTSFGNSKGYEGGNNNFQKV